MSPLEDPDTLDRLDQFLVPTMSASDIDDMIGMIPSLFGVSEKATFLGWRSLGLTATQALRVMELDEDKLDYWRINDPQFLEFEMKYLLRLQQECSIEIIKLGFLKNMAMMVAKDAQVIRLAVMDLNLLSKREFDYYMKVRSHYTPNDLYALEKAASPEKYKENITIQLAWGNTIQTHELIGGNNDEHLPDPDHQESNSVYLLPEGN